MTATCKYKDWHIRECVHECAMSHESRPRCEVAAPLFFFCSDDAGISVRFRYTQDTGIRLLAIFICIVLVSNPQRKKQKTLSSEHSIIM